MRKCDIDPFLKKVILEKKQTLKSAVHHVPNMNIIIDKYRE
jgi:hypothetical protein